MNQREARSYYYFKNTKYGLIYFVLSVLVSLILPKFRLSVYGSEINGLYQSIFQFVNIISFADAGVGAVTLAAYYKPIAENDITTINNIYLSSKRFYRRIGQFFFIYMIFIIILFVIKSNNIGFLPTTILVISISVTVLAKYFWGMTNGLLLRASQKTFYSIKIDTITLVINATLSILLMRLGFEIYWVTLLTAAIFLMRPIYIKIKLDSLYTLKNKTIIGEDPIKQKWYGVAQHVSSVINSSTDVVLLTFFGNYSLVSVYSVYFLVTEGIRKILMVLYRELLPAFGNIISTETESAVKNIFERVEWFSHFSTTILFTCTGILITPFVLLYTNNIKDVDYYSPYFAILLVVSQGLMCIKLPYQYLYQAANHFKQTQKSYIIEALLNIITSVILVNKYGLIGVAIGTLIAAFYRIAYLSWYLSKNIVHLSIRKTTKYFITDFVQIILAIVLFWRFSFYHNSYYMWILNAFFVLGTMTIVSCGVNFIFYKKYFVLFLKNYKSFLSKG